MNNKSVSVEFYESYKNQHGNAKNADIKRLANLLNMLFNNAMKNPTIKNLIIFAVVAEIGTRCGIKTYKAIKEEKRKDMQQNNIIKGEVIYETI